MSTNSTILELNNLGKTYGSVEALKSINLKITNHEIIGLIGPNGAGKTTLIRLLLGLIRPSTGNLSLFGLDCQSDSLQVRKHIGFAHTNPEYPPGITLKEYLEWVRQLYEVPKDIGQRRIDSLLNFFNLQNASSRNLTTFSAGMEVKTALIQAFLPAPKALILDEPTANLDPVARIQLMKLLKAFNKNNKTFILISSHSLYELEQVCTYYLFLDNGSVAWHGKVKDLGEKSLADFYLEIVK